MINRILLLSALVVCFATTSIAQNYTEANLLIDYEEVSADEVLAEETRNMLQAVLENVPEGEEIVYIEIRAHGASRDIGENRLDPFVQFFEEQGIGADKLDLVTQVDDKNRVHLKIRSSLKIITPRDKEKETEADLVATPAVKKVYCAGGSKKAEVFIVAPSSNIEIEGKEGTRVTINREDLVYPDGDAVQEQIKVELKEFYTSKDILLGELHTMEGDKVLETGGMINLKITANGEPLALRAGKSGNIKMPTKTAKNKKGMNLYFGKRMANGAVDWRLEERTEPIRSVEVNDTDENNDTDETTVTSTNAGFNLTSFIKIKTSPVTDSITRVRVAVNPRNVITGNNPGYKYENIYHTHEEEYFDIELPYLNPNIVDGVWVNTDKIIPFTNPKPVDILVQVEGIPNEGLGVDGALVSYTPRVALMLKSRAVFLRGNRVGENAIMKQQKMNFRNVPLNEAVVLVAFLDTGKELLFATKEVTATKNTETPVLVLEVLPKVEFDNVMTNIAN